MKKFSAAKLKELKDAMTHKTAVLSEDGLYRYRLTREVGFWPWQDIWLHRGEPFDR